MTRFHLTAPHVLGKGWRTTSRVEHPRALVSIVKTKSWIGSEVFCNWKRHFISAVKAKPQEKFLIILEGHNTVTHRVWVLMKLLANISVMLWLPSHSTHRMQPLGVVFFKPLSTYASPAIATKLGRKPGQRLLTEHPSLAGMAFPRVATLETVVNGYRNSGSWPVDQCVFTDDNCAVSMVTDQPEAIKVET
jgi:hypothetical protein